MLDAISKIAAVIVPIAGVAAIAASSASATTLTWAECGTVTESNGVFENSICSKEKASSEFDWVVPNEGVAVVATGTIEIEDAGAQPSAIELKCAAEASGKIGAGAGGTIESMTLTSCSVTKGTCESAKASAGNLPWKTEVAESSSEDRDQVKSGGSGAPTFTITCGTTKDVCTYESGFSIGVANLSTEGDVEGKFDSVTGKASCNHGGMCASSTGSLKGTLKLELSSKHGLRFEGESTRIRLKANNLLLHSVGNGGPTEAKVTLENISGVAAKVERIENFRVGTGLTFEPAEMAFCVGNYAAGETCTWDVHYNGIGNSVLSFTAVDQVNDRADKTITASP
jgi:hypothetical protein